MNHRLWSIDYGRPPRHRRTIGVRSEINFWNRVELNQTSKKLFIRLNCKITVSKTSQILQQIDQNDTLTVSLKFIHPGSVSEIRFRPDIKRPLMTMVANHGSLVTLICNKSKNWGFRVLECEECLEVMNFKCIRYAEILYFKAF